MEPVKEPLSTAFCQTRRMLASLSYVLAFLVLRHMLALRVLASASGACLGMLALLSCSRYLR